MLLPDMPKEVVDCVRYYCDGGCIGGNPGDAIYYSVAESHDGDETFEMLEEEIKCPDWNTNNQAEHCALYWALVRAEQRNDPDTRILIFSDSRLAVNQVNATWKANDEDLKKLVRRSRDQLTRMRGLGMRVVINWVPREKIEPILGH